ncbi:MAG: hypothetical protein EP349_03020 [Alphaproteobacteria bacterium]|nr:MAG: hypothetical protein EP349_03020 [Alphaproteobacteria bacterium]
MSSDIQDRESRLWHDQLIQEGKQDREKGCKDYGPTVQGELRSNIDNHLMGKESWSEKAIQAFHDVLDDPSVSAEMGSERPGVVVVRAIANGLRVMNPAFAEKSDKQIVEAKKGMFERMTGDFKEKGFTEGIGAAIKKRDEALKVKPQQTGPKGSNFSR